jgi:hypothetical protein
MQRRPEDHEDKTAYAEDHEDKTAYAEEPEDHEDRWVLHACTVSSACCCILSMFSNEKCTCGMVSLKSADLVDLETVAGFVN